MLRRYRSDEAFLLESRNAPEWEAGAKRHHMGIDAGSEGLTWDGTPQLYYSNWDDTSKIAVDFEQINLGEIMITALKEKLPSLHAEKYGVKSWMNIQKHGRFSAVASHRHSFIEMNYMYSGVCTNVVDGNAIRMSAGDLIIMKPGSAHMLPATGEDDLLINIILLPHAAASFLNSILVGKGDLSAFLVDAVYGDVRVSSYLYLKLGGFPHITDTINRLMCEYFDSGQPSAEELARGYLHNMFALILRESALNPEIASYSRPSDPHIAEIIMYIQENCVSCTRQSLAAHFGYSESRISGIISKSIGKSFLKLRNEFRIERAEHYLASTAIPVKMVAEDCGFVNMTQFYKLFRERFGRLPRELE
jgi:AraC-like DNA-binding protein/mannose-6-phosphate isomerase-like protein (cupin superfamily)